MRFKTLAAVLSVCFLTGCAVQPTGLDELFRAPRLTGQQSSLQKTLNSYLGEMPQLKYPEISAEGEALSPFHIGDFDGNGTMDAAAFYVSAAKGQNVHIAILEQKPSGEWAVTQEKEGLAPAIESVSSAELQPGAGQQLLVGYRGGSGEKYLAVYAYQESTLVEVLTMPYSQYQLHPLSNDEASDLVIIGPEQDGPMQLQLLTAQNGQFTLAQQLELSPLFLSCKGLYPSVNEDGSRFLILDGQTGTGLASMILRYNRRAKKLETFSPFTGLDVFSATQRFSPLLLSADVNGDGTIEIPSQETAGELGGLAVNRLSLVSWMDYTNQHEQEVRFGVADLEYGYFLSLPKQLEGNILVADGEEPDSWQVRSLDGETLYLTVRVVAPNVQNDEYFRVGNVGARKVQVHLPEESSMNAASLKSGFFELKR